MQTYCEILHILAEATSSTSMNDIAEKLDLDFNDAKYRFEFMHDQGWIVCSRRAPNMIRITSAGHHQLRTMEEAFHQQTQAVEAIHVLKNMNDNVRQNHAEEKAEKAKDRRFQLINTMLGAISGSLITLLVEHWAGIVDWVLYLFH